MTTGPENPYGEQDPPAPRRRTSRTARPAPPPPYGAPQPYQQQPYQQPYGQPAYGQPPYPYAAAPPTDGLALGAMITGIAALVLSCAYGVGLLASPVALVLGKVSMNRIKRSQGQLGGRGLALTGFVLGIIGTVLLVLAIVAVVIIIVVAINDALTRLGGCQDDGMTTGPENPYGGPQQPPAAAVPAAARSRRTATASPTSRRRPSTRRRRRRWCSASSAWSGS